VSIWKSAPVSFWYARSRNGLSRHGSTVASAMTTCWDRPARRTSLTSSISAPVVIGHTSWQRVIDGARITHFPRHWLSETGLPSASISGTEGTGRGFWSSVPIASGAGSWALAVGAGLMSSRASSASTTSSTSTAPRPMSEIRRSRASDTSWAQ